MPFGPEHRLAPIIEVPAFKLKTRIRNVTKEILKRIPDALVELAEQTAHDIDNVEPKIPVNTGALRKSKEINKINDRHVQLTYGGKVVTLDDGTTKDVYYAAEAHENMPYTRKPINWTREGSGPYFVSTKLEDKEARSRWAKVASRELKDVMKGLPDA